MYFLWNNFASYFGRVNFPSSIHLSNLHALVLNWSTKKQQKQHHFLHSNLYEWVNIICTMQFALTPFWFSLYYAILFIRLALTHIMLFVLLFLIHTICTKLAHAICPMDIFVFKLHYYCYFIQLALMLNLYILH